MSLVNREQLQAARTVEAMLTHPLVRYREHQKECSQCTRYESFAQPPQYRCKDGQQLWWEFVNL